MLEEGQREGSGRREEDHEHLMEFFCGSGLREKEVAEVLSHLRQALQAHEEGTISEEQHSEMTRRRWRSLSREKQ